MDNLKEVVKSNGKSLTFVICLLLYNAYSPLNVILAALMVAIACISSVEENLIILFVASIFDEVLVLDLIGGSIARVLILICLMKLVLYFVKHKKIDIIKSDIMIIAFFIISMLLGIFNGFFGADVIMFEINIVLIVMYRIYFRTSKAESVKLYKSLAWAVVISGFVGVVYGVTHFNFLIENGPSYTIYRFNGIYEPNFMSAYLNIALVILFSNFIGVNKRLRRVLITLFTVMICMTVSMSGIGIMTAIYLIYIFSLRKDIWKRIMNTVVVLLICVICFGGFNYGIGLYNNYLERQYAVSEEVVENDVIEESQEVIPEVVPEEILDEPMEENEEDSSESEIVEKDSESDTELEIIEVDDNPFGKRVESIINLLEEGDIDTVTSGRTSLIRDFYHACIDRNIFAQLFGNGPIPKKVYSTFFWADKYSHNSYVDMLYNFGVIGTVIMLLFIFKRALKGDFMSTMNADIRREMKCIRILCLFYGIVLSIYSRRMFIILFLI